MKGTMMTTAAAKRADAGILTGPERPLGIRTGSLRQAWSKGKAYAATIAELKGLTDRQLSDVGASRDTLKQFARRAVYGN
jgi:uncharacterized protein YjiS (DUF1127 family)